MGDNDITFGDPNNGVVLEDRDSGTLYRLYVDVGVLNIETA